jgi:hypothetical protein
MVTSRGCSLATALLHAYDGMPPASMRHELRSAFT